MSVPRRVSDTKRISEVSKPTNRASAPLRQLDCCYSAAQRGCWAGKKMKEPFVDACSDTAHMYAYHVTPFTSDPLLLGFSLEGIISLYNIEERQWFKQGFYVATAPLKIALEQAGEKKKITRESHSLSESLNFAMENQVLHLVQHTKLLSKSVHMWTAETAPCHKARRAAICTAPPRTATSHWTTFCPSLPFLSGRQKEKRDKHPRHPAAGVHWGSLEQPCTENLPNYNTVCYNQNMCSRKISTQR